MAMMGYDDVNVSVLAVLGVKCQSFARFFHKHQPSLASGVVATLENCRVLMLAEEHQKIYQDAKASNRPAHQNMAIALLANCWELLAYLDGLTISGAGPKRRYLGEDHLAMTEKTVDEMRAKITKSFESLTQGPGRVDTSHGTPGRSELENNIVLECQEWTFELDRMIA